MSRPRIRIPEPLRPLAKLARHLGWRITQTGTGHLRWQPPSGRAIITASTPGGAGARNDRARLRRAGLREETS